MCRCFFFPGAKKKKKKEEEAAASSRVKPNQNYTEDAKKSAIMKLKTQIFKHLSSADFS